MVGYPTTRMREGVVERAVERLHRRKTTPTENCSRSRTDSRKWTARYGWSHATNVYGTLSHGVGRVYCMVEFV